MSGLLIAIASLSLLICLFFLSGLTKFDNAVIDNILLFPHELLFDLAPASHFVLLLLLHLTLGLLPCIRLLRHISDPLQPSVLVAFLHPPDCVWIEGDHVRLELVQQRPNLSLSALLQVCEWVRIVLRSVEIGLPTSRNDDGAKSLLVANAAHILVGSEPHSLDGATARKLVSHVRRSDLCLQGVRTPERGVTPVAYGEDAALANVDVGRGSPTGVVGVRLLVHAKVPDAHMRVGPAGDHVPPGPIDGEGAQGGATVTEHLDEIVAAGGGPERDGSIGVAQVDDGVGGVLPHDRARAQLRPVSGHGRARGGVLVSQIAGPPNCGCLGRQREREKEEEKSEKNRKRCVESKQLCLDKSSPDRASTNNVSAGVGTMGTK